MKRNGLLTALLFVLLGCDSRPTLSEARINDPELGKKLPPGFLFGAATASHQVEGGNDNDWTEWEKGRFDDGTSHIRHADQSGASADSWNRFDTDVALLKRLGANTYRLSLEWSRIEPQKGAFDEAAIAKYRGWMQILRAEGITPMVTIHHFTLPRWVSDAGGWESEETIGHFVAYAQHVTAALGGEVDFWVTLNEPNVYAVQGYILGSWPPGKVDQVAAARALANQLHAHGKAVTAMRAVDTIDADGDGHATRIGIAHHVRLFQASTGATMDGAIAALTDDFFNESVVASVRSGRVRLSVPGTVSIDEPSPDLKGSLDWLGINYYTRDHVRADLGDPSLSKQYVPADLPKNDLGWELYPEGLFLVLQRFASEGLPLYVTENGMADNTENGEQRPRMLRAHLAAMELAVERGVDVRGYLHWSLMDNFEWAEGFEPRFGLFRVDFASPEKTRTPTAAVKTFQDVARNLGLKPAEE